MKLTRELDEVLALPEPGDKVGRLNVIQQQLQTKLTLLQSIDNEILALCNVDDIEHEIEESEAVSAKVLDYKQRIELFLNLPIVPTAATGSSIPPPLATPLVAKTRLPKLELHKYKSNVTSWAAFWDSYKSAVHDNPDISKIDKFNYLSSLLEGPASKSIQGLSLTEANYITAVALLKERFGNPQAIISAHMDELLKLPDCSQDRPSLLRSVYDKITIDT